MCKWLDINFTLTYIAVVQLFTRDSIIARSAFITIYTLRVVLTILAYASTIKISKEIYAEFVFVYLFIISTFI